MRTLALLAALLLLALQARAQVLQQTADQVPAQDQPEAQDQDQPEAQDQDQPEAQDQDQAGAEDRDMVVSFTGEERLTREASGSANINRKKFCRCRSKCRRGFLGILSERSFGVCKVSGQPRKLCCR